MHIYTKNIFAKFHPNPISINWKFFEEVPQQEEQQEQDEFLI